MKTKNIISIGWELHVALLCVRESKGIEAMQKMIDYMRSSKLERKLVLCDARTNPLWSLVKCLWQ